MIIAFKGYKQSGKTTAAQYLEEKYGFIRINFKDALVKEIKERYPDLLEEILHIESRLDSKYAHHLKTVDDLFIYKPPLMRALMVNFGTDDRRKDNNNYWVDKWKYAAAKVYPENNIVVDDVRFLNEAVAVNDFGGNIVQIERSDITDGGTHVSETEQNDIFADYIMSVEKGDHESLYKKLDAIIENEGGV